MNPSQLDKVLARLTAICAAFPGATRRDAGAHAAFEVRGKVFAWFINDHHGDGIVAVTFKVPLGENQDLVAADPSRYFMPSYMAARGRVGVRLDRAGIDWESLAEFLREAYRRAAPKRLSAQLESRVK